VDRSPFGNPAFAASSAWHFTGILVPWQVVRWMEDYAVSQLDALATTLMRDAYKVVVEKYEGKTQFGRPRLGGRIIKWILKKKMGNCGLDSFGSG
jgi:hypothetical protein